MRQNYNGKLPKTFTSSEYNYQNTRYTVRASFTLQGPCQESESESEAIKIIPYWELEKHEKHKHTFICFVGQTADKEFAKKGKNCRNFQIFYDGHVSALQYSEATRQEVKQAPFHSILKKGTLPKHFIPNIVSSSFHHFRV